MAIFSTGTRVSMLFASCFATLGVQLPFYPMFLAERGLGDGEIALVVAVPMVLRVTTVSALGAFADRVGDRRRALGLYAGLALLGCLAIGPARGFAALFAATVAMSLFWNGVLPVTDALATSCARRGEAVYGRMRLWGSIAFVAGNLAAGALIGAAGAGALYPPMLAAFVLQFAATALAPAVPVASEPVASGAARSMWAGFAELLRDRWFVAVLIGSALVQSSHAMLYGFASLWWRSIGFSGGEIGLLWAVGVVGEVLLFAQAPRAIAAIGARGLLFVGALGAVLRWTLFPFVGESGLAWTMLQFTHAASFAATHLGTMQVVTRAVGDGRAATAQGLMVTFSGLAMALATLASGALYGRFGGDGFLGMAVAAGLGTAVFVAAAGLRRSEG